VVNADSSQLEKNFANAGPHRGYILSDWLTRARGEFRIKSLRLEALKNFEDMDGDSGESLLTEVIALYLEVSPKSFEQIEAAVKAEDRKGMYQTAHSLKSSSGNLGAIRLAALCEALEGQTDQEHTVPIALLRLTFLEIECEFRLVLRDLKIVQLLVTGSIVPAELSKAS
jgi:HPt (histidine-containing phosphotransfer) domain-containing protein